MKLKTFKFKTLRDQVAARQAQKAWIEANRDRYEWREVYVNNAYAVEYRPHRIIVLAS